MSMLPADDACIAQLAAEKSRRVQAEAALAAAEARVVALEQQLAMTASTAQRRHHQLIAFSQHLGTGLALVDQAGHIEFVNEPFRELFDLKSDSTRADACPIYPSHPASLEGAFHDPATFVAQACARHQDGQTALLGQLQLADGRVVELDYLILEQHQAGRLICYHDVTTRHQQDAQLRTLAYILEQHPNPILRLTPAGEVLYANPAAAPLAETLGAAEPGNVRHELLLLVQQALHTGNSHQQELALADQYYLVTVMAVPGETYATLYLTDITARRQAEQELVRQRTFYEMVLEQVPAGVAVFDPDHRYLFVNPLLEPDPAIRAWLIGKDNFESCAYRHRPREMAERRQEYFTRTVQERKEVTWEETLVQPRIGLRHFMRRYRPVLAPDGNVLVVVSSGIDITERHQAEIRLAEQQLFMQQLVDTIPSMLCVLTSAEHISFSNAAFQKFWKQDKESIEMRRQTKSFEQFVTWNRQVLEQQCVVQAELPIEVPGGEVRYFQMDKRPLRQHDGSIAVLTLHTDITEIKRLREQTERREKQYYDLVYYSQALICTHDLQGKILSVNPAIERLLGAPASRLIGHNLRDALPPEHRGDFDAYLAGASQPQPSVMTITTTKGEKRYLHYYTYQVAEAGQEPYVVASGYDITPGVRAERALQQAKKEAEENARAKESFLARMSHEIRTPLNGVLGMAALLAKTPLSQTQQEYLTTMEQAGQHLLALVNDVLDMAKITTQHLQLEQAAFDPNVVLQGVRQTLANLAEHKGLRLTTEYLPAGSPAVLGDAYRLRQVLLNLVGNAIKFTEEGSVHLGVAVQQETPEALTLRFWVQDTGIGISQEQQESIFDAFTQASSEISRRFGGTGLGLAISQQLVQHMDGTLALCSAPEQGSTFSFTLTLPRAEALPAAPNQLPTNEPVNYEALRDLHVLLAEDNMVNQWIAIVMLEHWGVCVEAVGTGTDALNRLQNKRYDAAILDIQMPGLSGVEVATAIRQHPSPEYATIPLIALTANAFEADLAKYLVAGMSACLTKPFEEAALLQLLVQLTKDQPRINS
ncbi:PAS domain S-box protein [Hymenobacter sp. GOD-10R]|uniref:PAS domain S-box protein n=1 Tax=Hymenobacter sp. GOD-10R TaxID=3093922 RepID=UPI002D7A1529|nr:PAS domain S-box protein [Hymenobacter sp. GOD-10R]WRQ26207.1 PAS domain S-box protein [Hymenobacter sp. GOD-10R]